MNEPIVMGILGIAAMLSAIGLLVCLYLYFKGFREDPERKRKAEEMQNGKY